MKRKILITDSLFIFSEHEKMLTNAGYEIERLDIPKATEEELVTAVKGKVGYVLGGIEKITENVIEAGDELKAIAFTGSDWRQFIPGHEIASKKGIAIANTPGANSFAVAEYALTLMLAMTRNIFELGRTGKATFKTTSSISELTVGIIGMGHIGSTLAPMLKGVGAKKIIYTSNERKSDVEKNTGAEFVDLETLLKTSDIVTLHIPKHTGEGFLNANMLGLLKDGSLIVNCAYSGAIDKEALFAELKTGRLRAAFDKPAGEEFQTLPLSNWFNSNADTAYNTHQANKRASDMATQSLLNMLESGSDQYKVN